MTPLSPYLRVPCPCARRHVGRNTKFTGLEPGFNVVFIEAVKEWVDQVRRGGEEEGRIRPGWQ